MKKGFTLIELLVVIAILAVLMSVIVITLNPAEMLKKTRDTKRIADLDALRTAISLFITDIGGLYSGTGNPPSGTFSATSCYTHNTGAGTLSTYLTTGTHTTCSAFATPTASQAIDGTGWIPIKLSAISSGAPLSSLPIDPKNQTNGGTSFGAKSSDGPLFYIFNGSSASGTFKLIANMESSYYASSGSGDVESKDGGRIIDAYEVGSDLTGL